MFEAEKIIFRPDRCQFNAKFEKFEFDQIGICNLTEFVPD